MPFPPNLGITSALIIDSRSPILLPQFPSLSPKMNAYSIIRKSGSTRSKSVDFADFSFLNPTPTNQGNINSISKLQSHERNTTRSPIQEHKNVNGIEETFNIIHGGNRSVASAHSYKEMNDHQNFPSQNSTKKKRFSRRSASLFDGYHQIHQQFDSIAEDVDQQEAKPYVKKKGKIFKACKRLFRL